MEIVKISETKFVRKIKSLPISTQRITGIMVLLVLFIALPLFIWAVVTQRVFFKKQAASGEMSGEPGVCIAYNNIIDVSTGGPCNDIQMAIAASSNITRTTIRIADGDYNIYATNNTDPIITLNKPITFLGNPSNPQSRPRITFYSNMPNPVGILIINQLNYTSQQQMIDNAIEFNNLNLVSNLGNEGNLIKSVNRIIKIQNSQLYYYASGAVNSNSSLITLNQTIGYGFPAVNSQIINSDISASQNGFSLSTNLLDTTFGIYIDHSTLGRIYGRGPTNSLTNLPSTWIQYSSIYRGIQLQNQNVDLKYNLFYGGIGVHLNSTFGQVFHNSIINSEDYGLSVTGTHLSAIDNNLIVNSQRTGVYITQWPGETQTVFSHNGVWNNHPNYDFVNNNPPLLPDQTGTFGNINTDPLLSVGTYCLLPGSPAIWGNVSVNAYMGHVGPCQTTATPAPSPTPSTSPIGVVPPGTNGRPTVGPPNAPIVIIEFIDFQCSFCKTFNDQTLPLLANAYPNKIRFIIKEFPLAIHPQAYQAAEAAECAFEQNKFEHMYDLLFINQSSFASNPFSGFAQQIGLNMEQFNNCMSTKKYDSVINQDIADAYANGANGTPTFLINGVLLQGAQPLSAFKAVIDSILPSPTPVPGDVNGDGHVNIVDIGIIIDNYRLSPINDPRADINNDGVVNIVDIGIIIDNYEL